METTVRNRLHDGNVAWEHNMRDENLVRNEPHIDAVHGTHEVWGKDRGLREAYEEIFGDAISAYNAKQTRNDRKMTVDSYMRSVEEDTRGRAGKKKRKDGSEGKRLAYERVISVGNVTEKQKDRNGRIMYDDEGYEIHPYAVPYELNYEVCKRYVETFEQRNPHMRIVRTDWHADEGYTNGIGEWEWATEHAHLTFVPVADGYQRGLALQNAMGRALAQQGIKDGYFDASGQPCEKGTPGAEWRCAYDIWNAQEQACMEEILQEEYARYCRENPEYAAEHGTELTVLHPDAKKGVESLSAEDFRTKQALKSEIEGLKEDVRDAEFTIDYAWKKQAELKERQAELDEQRAYMDAVIAAGNGFVDIMEASKKKLDRAAEAYKAATMQTKKKDACEDIMEFMRSHSVKRKNQNGDTESITLWDWYEKDRAARQREQQRQLAQQEAAARAAAQAAARQYRKPAPEPDSMQERRVQLSEELERNRKELGLEYGGIWDYF